MKLGGVRGAHRLLRRRGCRRACTIAKGKRLRQIRRTGAGPDIFRYAGGRIGRRHASRPAARFMIRVEDGGGKHVG
jgi:hypothetical protein